MKDAASFVLIKLSFFKIWSGIIIAVEKSEHIKLAKKDKNIIGKVLTYTSIFWFFIKQPNLFQSLYFFLSIAGLAISILIVLHELGRKSKILDKFCSGNNENVRVDIRFNVTVKDKEANLTPIPDGLSSGLF